MSAGTVLLLYDVDGDCQTLSPSCESRIADAYEAWAMEQRETILRLEKHCGDPYVMKGSQISNWAVSTREGRKRHVALQAAIEAEDAEDRKAYGLVKDEKPEWLR